MLNLPPLETTNRRNAERKSALDVQICLVELGQGRSAMLLDVSETGIGVQTVEGPGEGLYTSFRFTLPETEVVIIGEAELAWADRAGRMGLRFTALAPEMKKAIREWVISEANPLFADAPVTDEIADLDARDRVAQLEARIIVSGWAQLQAINFLVDQVAAMTQASGVAIAVEDGTGIVCKASSGIAPQVGVRVDPRSGLSWECVRTREIVQCVDTETDPRVDRMVCRQLNMRSAMLVPVLKDGRVAGLVEVFSSRALAFNNQTVILLRRVAEAVASLDETAPDILDEPLMPPPESVAPPASIATPAPAPPASTPRAPMPVVATPQVRPVPPVAMPPVAMPPAPQPVAPAAVAPKPLTVAPAPAPKPTVVVPVAPPIVTTSAVSAPFEPAKRETPPTPVAKPVEPAKPVQKPAPPVVVPMVSKPVAPAPTSRVIPPAPPVQPAVSVQANAIPAAVPQSAVNVAVPSFPAAVPVEKRIESIPVAERTPVIEKAPEKIAAEPLPKPEIKPAPLPSRFDAAAEKPIEFRTPARPGPLPSVAFSGAAAAAQPAWAPEPAPPIENMQEQRTAFEPELFSAVTPPPARGTRKVAIGVASVLLVASMGYAGWYFGRMKSGNAPASSKTETPAANIAALPVTTPPANTQPVTTPPASEKPAAKASAPKPPETSASTKSVPVTSQPKIVEAPTIRVATAGTSRSGQQDAVAPSIAVAPPNTLGMASILANPVASPALGQQKISQGVTGGKQISRFQPVYPTAARAMRLSGTVTVRAHVDKSGAVTDVKVLKGHSILNEAALDAVRRWKYQPFLLNGQPIDNDINVEVRFDLPQI